MTTSTAVAIYDDATLDALAGMASPADIAASAGPDILKINYDEDSIHPRGVWVLGQKKKDNVIVEEGVVIDKVILLAARCRYSYYHEATGDYVNTMVFEAGGQPPDKAEADAKVAQLGGQLKFQTVLYGLAIIEGGFKEFVSYQGGVAYQPLKAHLQDLSVIITPTRKIPAPLFAHVTILGETVKGKKGTITYYTPTFSKGAQITFDQLGYFANKRDEAVNYIAHQNAMASERKEKVVAPVAPPASTMYTPPAYVPPAAPTPRPPVDLGAMNSAMATPPKMEDDVPFDMPGTPAAGGPPADDGSYDIEAAMAAILAK